jgi:hypothetical protein
MSWEKAPDPDDFRNIIKYTSDNETFCEFIMRVGKTLPDTLSDWYEFLYKRTGGFTNVAGGTGAGGNISLAAIIGSASNEIVLIWRSSFDPDSIDHFELRRFICPEDTCNEPDDWSTNVDVLKTDIAPDQAQYSDTTSSSINLRWYQVIVVLKNGLKYTAEQSTRLTSIDFVTLVGSQTSNVIQITSGQYLYVIAIANGGDCKNRQYPICENWYTTAIGYACGGCGAGYIAKLQATTDMNMKFILSGNKYELIKVDGSGAFVSKIFTLNAGQNGTDNVTPTGASATINVGQVGFSVAGDSIILDGLSGYVKSGKSNGSKTFFNGCDGLDWNQLDGKPAYIDYKIIQWPSWAKDSAGNLLIPNDGSATFGWGGDNGNFGSGGIVYYKISDS